MRPGVNVTTREFAPPSAIPVDVGTGFFVGITESGPTIPDITNLIRNMDEYDTVYAPSGRSYQQGAVMHDSADEYFKEGGARLYVGRLLGTGATAATNTLTDATPAIVFNVTAKGSGEWGNNITVEVQTTTENPDIGAGNYRINVWRDKAGPAETLLEVSYDLADAPAGLDWSTSSGYIKLTGGASVLDPKAQSVKLAGGLSDLATITNPTWKTAANNLSAALGPGILMAPGATADQIHADMASSAAAMGRVAFLDGPNTATAATLIASAKAIVDAATNKRSRFASLFVPWLVIPGLTTATVRTVPPSAAIAGLFARNMSSGHTANEPAAGELGIFRTVKGMSQTYSDADRKSLNSNGVDVCRDVFGTFKVYGWRTVADPVNDPRWINLGNSLLHRQIVAMAGAVGERFVFRQIDGSGRLAGQFESALGGEVCMPLYLSGALFGSSADEAYKIDTGPSVNTPETIAAQELHAVISCVMSPFAEEVDIEIVKYLVTEGIPA